MTDGRGLGSAIKREKKKCGCHIETLLSVCEVSSLDEFLFRENVGERNNAKVQQK